MIRDVYIQAMGIGAMFLDMTELKDHLKSLLKTHYLELYS